MYIYNIEWLVKPKANEANEVAANEVAANEVAANEVAANEVAANGLANEVANGVGAAKPLMRGVMVVSFRLR
jgi:hypothetical protein